jgi:PKD repeat protein
LEYGDNECGSDYGYVRVYFRNRPPVALFTVTPSSGNTGTSFNFDASASYDSDPGDFIAKYEWDWSNNGVYDYSSSNATATYRYDSIGNYTVKLRVTDNDGAQATTTKTITVENRPPIASFTVEPSSGNTQTPFQFDASASTDPDGSIVKYEWDWNGDGIVDYASTGPTATHQYLEPGTYTVTLTVTDCYGAISSVTEEVEVMQIFEGSCRDKERVEFGVSMDSPGTIKVTLDWDNPENDLDLFLIDESGKIIASSTGTMNHEEITAQVSAGVYTVRVYGYSVVGEQEFEGTCNYPINP